MTPHFRLAGGQAPAAPESRDLADAPQEPDRATMARAALAKARGETEGEKG